MHPGAKRGGKHLGKDVAVLEDLAKTVESLAARLDSLEQKPATKEPEAEEGCDFALGTGNKTEGKQLTGEVEKLKSGLRGNHEELAEQLIKQVENLGSKFLESIASKSGQVLRDHEALAEQLTHQFAILGANFVGSMASRIAAVVGASCHKGERQAPTGHKERGAYSALPG